MNRAIIAAICVFSLHLAGSAAYAQRGAGAPAPAADGEVLVSTLPLPDITKKLADGTAIDHVTEVVHGKPVAIVVRSPWCQDAPAGACRTTAQLTILQPDGKEYWKGDTKFDKGGGSAQVTFVALAPSGLYKVVARVQDPVGRRFATFERQFALK
jgi:hypothetical protein